MSWMAGGCPFCAEIEARAGEGRQPGPVAVTLEDAQPVTPGHVLVVPVRHVERIEELSPDEWAAVSARAREEGIAMLSRPGITGFNLGVNSGPVAGQTVAHAHVHVIPRRAGDCPDPRGGVRRVLGSS